jgi:hypothetical protein
MGVIHVTEPSSNPAKCAKNIVGVKLPASNKQGALYVLSKVFCFLWVGNNSSMKSSSGLHPSSPHQNCSRTR